MPDVFTKAKRSEVMSRIRSAGNRDTELRLIAVFRANGITGWRRGLSVSSVVQSSPDSVIRARATLSRSRPRGAAAPEAGFGSKGTKGLRPFTVKPDFVFRKLKLAVFVDGCFWHGCPRHFNKPRNSAAFWRKKIAANRARDRLVNRTLRRMGWRVLRIWEHELVRRNLGRLLRRTRKAIAV